MLELYGRKYVIEHILSAYIAELEERRYRAYITDALLILTKNTAKYAGGDYLQERWAAKFIPQDTRSGDEIALDVIRRAGLKLKDGE